MSLEILSKTSLYSEYKRSCCYSEYRPSMIALWAAVFCLYFLSLGFFVQISLCRQHADQIHREAQELNKMKEFGKATAKYKEYVLMNKKAEMMAKLFAANQPAKPTISTVEPPIFSVLPSQLHVPATAGGTEVSCDSSCSCLFWLPC